MSVPTRDELIYTTGLYRMAAEEDDESEERQRDRPDRARARAALRRGLGKPPGDAIETHRYVVLAATRAGVEPSDDHYVVAALFGLHARTPSPNLKRWNIGASLGVLRRLAKEQLGENEEPANVEARLNTLLKATPDSLPSHLQRVVSLLKTEDIAVDWAQLLHDLRLLRGRTARQVRREWATSYWTGSDRTKPAADGPSAPDDQDADDPYQDEDK